MLPKVLLGFALAVLIGTAALGYMTKENIGKLQGSLSTTKTTLAKTEGDLKRTRGDLETRTTELAAANTKIDEKDKEIGGLKIERDGLNTQLAAVKTDLEAKTARITKLEEDLAKIPTDGGLRPEDVKAKIDELNATIEKYKTEAAESQALVVSISSQKKAVEEKLAVLEQYKKSRLDAMGAAGLRGRVLAVNAGWNFVVLSVGDKQGAVMNAPMLVVRDGQPIAKARVTSVEQSTSIADVLPNSLVKGMSVQPGDTVIFEGRTKATTPPTDIPTAGGALPH